MTKKEFEIQLALGSLTQEEKIRAMDCAWITEDHLDILAKDSDALVRFNVIFQPKLRIESLKQLTEDKKEFIATHAIAELTAVGEWKE